MRLSHIAAPHSLAFHARIAIPAAWHPTTKDAAVMKFCKHTLQSLHSCCALVTLCTAELMHDISCTPLRLLFAEVTRHPSCALQTACTTAAVNESHRAALMCPNSADPVHSLAAPVSTKLSTAVQDTERHSCERP